MPIGDGEDARLVNWLEIEILNAAGKTTYKNAQVTSLPLDETNVAELAARGRARWKIENESSNVLKTKGYDLEHNFGHGKENLSALSVTMNLLAFAWHALLDLTAKAWQTARQRTGSAQALLPGPRRHHRLPSVPQPGRPHANPHRRRATPRRPCPPESHQHQTKTPETRNAIPQSFTM